MADYKELLRRAVEALPENNGAARRAVYEKARAALVGQLRAINPPLAARDITAHRLQLEDCIRQVEQEASEAVIAGLGSSKEEAPPPPPVYFEPPAKKAPTSVARPVAKPVPGASAKEPPRPLPPGGSIEEIIAAANAEPPEPAPVEARRSVVRPEGKPMGKPVPKLVPSTNARQQIAAPIPARAAAPPPPPPQPIFEEPEIEEELPAPPPRTNGKAGRPLPSIVARAEAAKSRTGAAAFGAPIGGATRGPELTPRRELSAPAARLEPTARGAQTAARQIASEPVSMFNPSPVSAAMSAVREVEVEPQQPLTPQDSIDRAIATLDREARGEFEDEPEINGALHELPDLDDEEEAEPPRKNGFANGMLRADAPAVPMNGRNNGKPMKPSAFAKNARQGGPKREAEQAFPKAREEGERRGMGAVTVFLIVFVVLLLGAGGAGFWAWREGFINLDQMFGRPAGTEQVATTPATPAAEDPGVGVGNNNTPAEPVEPKKVLQQDDQQRLNGDTPVVAESPALPLVPTPGEQRLTNDTPALDSAEAEVAKLDPANTVGGQSLLLEASDNGKTGAVPFSGSIDWSKGTDEMGLPTLIGKASIPARNLSVDVLIRKNSDASLPASHLMEVNFKVSDSFVGGSIAGLPGVLLKNEELVQGTPLVGASARVVGNSFLFALSASPEDIQANSNLLMSRKYMDLALIYATGKRAIITLEKDPAAVTLFNEVVGAWTSKAAAAQ